MARIRKSEIGAVNIVTHPHSPKGYDDLLSDACNGFYYGKIRGLDGGVIGEKSEWSGNPEDPISGFIWRFVNLDSNAPWANLKTRKEQDPAKTPVVPPELKPHLRKEAFVFFPKGHRMFFCAKTFSPGSVERMLKNMFSTSKIVDKYGEVEVHLETSQEAIETILKMERLSSVELFISLPNSDELDGEARFKERMDALNARKNDLKLTAGRGESITPDEDLKTQMVIARSNGYVKANGYSKTEERLEISTRSHPFKYGVEYDSTQDSFMSVLRREALHLIQSIMKKTKP